MGDRDEASQMAMHEWMPTTVVGMRYVRRRLIVGGWLLWWGLRDRRNSPLSGVRQQSRGYPCWRYFMNEYLTILAIVLNGFLSGLGAATGSYFATKYVLRHFKGGECVKHN
jgi:hypothetical protein